MIVRVHGEYKYATDLFAGAINSVGAAFKASFSADACFHHVMKVNNHYAVFIDAYNEFSNEFEQVSCELSIVHCSVVVDEIVKSVGLLDRSLGQLLIDSHDNIYKVAAQSSSINLLHKQRVYDYVRNAEMFLRNL